MLKASRRGARARRGFVWVSSVGYTPNTISFRSCFRVRIGSALVAPRARGLLPFAACAALIAAFVAVAPPAGAAPGVRSTLECEYVGNRENLPGRGGGDERAARPTRSRFAGAAQWLTQGPPVGSGGFDFEGVAIPRVGFSGAQCQCDAGGQADPFSESGHLAESFVARGALEVPALRSVHGRPFFQNTPTCVESGQSGLPARFRWTFAVSRPIVSDLTFQVCLDVRKCQEEDDRLGPAASAAFRDFSDAFGIERPLAARVIHHRGTLWEQTTIGPSRCACEDTSLELVRQPTLGRADPPPPWQPLPDPDEVEEIESSVALVGQNCLSITADNLGRSVAARDFVTLELAVPASTRVRVRASADAADVCYVGAVLDGERD